jgi:hypothetical protein
MRYICYAGETYGKHTQKCTPDSDRKIKGSQKSSLGFFTPKLESAGEHSQLHDCFIINLDIEDSPVAEISLVDVYDMVTSTRLNNYREAIRETIMQILKDTMWVSTIMMKDFMKTSFVIFEAREGGMTVLLRTSRLQRFISQSILS